MAFLTLLSLYVFLTRTFIGKAILATYANRETAQLLAINVKRIDIITYGLGTAIAGIAGLVIALTFSFSPSSVLPWTVIGFAVAVIGGKGSVLGTFIAGLTVGIVEAAVSVTISANWTYFAKRIRHWCFLFSSFDQPAYWENESDASPAPILGWASCLWSDHCCQRDLAAHVTSGLLYPAGVFHPLFRRPGAELEHTWWLHRLPQPRTFLLRGHWGLHDRLPVLRLPLVTVFNIFHSPRIVRCESPALLLSTPLCFRIRGSYFLIATMLVLFIMQTLANNLRSLTNGADGIDFPLFTSDFARESRIWFYVGIGLVVLTTLVAFCIERSRLGLNLMAIREDEDVARTMGVKVVHCKAIAFMVSAALAGLLGAAYTYRAHVIEPTTAFSVEMSAAPIMMAILGGSRTWIGPLIGAVIADAVSNILSLSIGNEYSDMFFAVFLICVVLLLPEGITGLFARLRAKPTKAEPPSGATTAMGPGSALHPV